MTIHETPDQQNNNDEAMRAALAMNAALKSEADLLAAMRAAMEAGQIAQRMVGRLLNAVLFLGIANVVLMTALILQAMR
jgi:hypothetical protein